MLFEPVSKGSIRLVTQFLYFLGYSGKYSWDTFQKYYVRLCLKLNSAFEIQLNCRIYSICLYLLKFMGINRQQVISVIICNSTKSCFTWLKEKYNVQHELMIVQESLDIDNWSGKSGKSKLDTCTTRFCSDI